MCAASLKQVNCASLCKNSLRARGLSRFWSSYFPPLQRKTEESGLTPRTSWKSWTTSRTHSLRLISVSHSHFPALIRLRPGAAAKCPVYADSASSVAWLVSCYSETVLSCSVMSTSTEIDPALKNFIIQKLVHENLTYEQLSMVLQQMYPGNRGFSVRSLQRFCASENIRKTSRLNHSELHLAVQESVLQVLYMHIL